MLTKQEQARSLEAMQRAVAAQKQRDARQEPRDHHRRGLERAEEFIKDFRRACPSSTALDFDLGLRLQQLLCFQSFENVFKLGQRLGDRAQAFVTALAKVSLGGAARSYHDARFRYYVLYLAASRSQALAFLDEIFAQLNNEEERRWIEMLRIADVLATKRTVAFVRDPRKAKRFEVRFVVGAAESVAVISGENVEFLEEVILDGHPTKSGPSRMVSLSDQARRRLRSYLDTRGELEADAPLFPGLRPWEPLHPHSAIRLLVRAF